MAIAGAALTFILYLAGFHESPEKMPTAQWVGGIGGVAIGVTCLALAMRERRSLTPAETDWGYGRALGAGVMTGLFASLFGLVTGYVYFGIVNPGFSEVIFQSQVVALEARGMTSAQIERVEPMLRKWISPVALTVMQGFSGFVWSLVLSLIVAIFLRKRPTDTPAEAPPPVEV